MISILLACILLAVLAQSRGGRRVLRVLGRIVICCALLIWIVIVFLMTAYIVHAI